MFEKIRARLKALTEAPRTITERSAPRIQAKLIADATTRRGNVPSYSPGGPNVPIRVVSIGDEIRVTAVDWVLRKAADKGQHEVWAGIVREEAKRSWWRR